MAELLLTMLLLLTAEDIVFRGVVRNRGFLSLKKDGAGIYAIILGVISAAASIIGGMLVDDGSVVLNVFLAAVLAALCVLYLRFVKKDSEWYFSLTLIINAAVAVVLGSLFPDKGISASPVVGAVVNAVFAMFGVLFFIGIKDNFSRGKRSVTMTCIYAAVIVGVAVIAACGFAV